MAEGLGGTPANISLGIFGPDLDESSIFPKCCYRSQCAISGKPCRCDFFPRAGFYVVAIVQHGFMHSEGKLLSFSTRKFMGSSNMMRLTKIATLLLLAVLATFAIPSTSPAQISVGVAVHIGPPALPVYEQPICPAPGYIWTPGYWAWGPDGYFWVPGTWVIAPAPGLLWTPGYWGWGDGGYLWHAGYWGPHVGFYGGINYGFGYPGEGFYGGEWRHGVYRYNTAYTRVNTTIIHNTYVNRTVIHNNNNRVSYNGGHGGINARPNRMELAADREHHFQPTAVQTEHQHAAGNDRAFLASQNHGNPRVAATERPADFRGRGAMSARPDSAPDRRPSPNNVNHSNGAMNRNDRPPNNAPNSNMQSSNSNRNSNRANGNYNAPRTNQPSAARQNYSRPQQAEPRQNSNHQPAPRANSPRPSQPEHQSRPPEHEPRRNSGHGGPGRGR